MANSTKSSARQYPLTAMVELTKANIGTGNGVDVPVPPGAFVTVSAAVDTAFNSATTTTLTVGDGTTTFIAAQSAKATGVVTVAVANAYYPNGGTISVTMAETGAAATAGHAVASISYVVSGRHSELQL